jgi:replication fork protection complex subunit Csm3/Swi3
MVQAVSSPGASPRDELVALFDFDPAEEDILNTTHGSANADSNNTRETIREHSAAARRSEGLGLDEEVKIAKKRQPVAKLDATR